MLDSETPAQNNPSQHPLGRFMMRVLWPAFLVAIAASGIIFSLVDPLELANVDIYLQGSRQAAYTIGFLLFWLLASLSSTFTYYLTEQQ